MRLIVTADWHLRATRPRCRIDEDWIRTQENALRQVGEHARRREAHVCVVGDVFHTNSDASFQCVRMVQDLASSLDGAGLWLCVLAGNHDLPYHSTENIRRSAIGLVLGSRNVHSIAELGKYVGRRVSASNFDEEDDEGAELVFKHVLCFPDKRSTPPNVSAVTAGELLERFRNAKMVFTGDNHHQFHKEEKGKDGKSRHVLNPGCLIRQSFDFADYRCGVWFVDTSSGETEFLPIRDGDDVIDGEYRANESEREGRIGAFVEKLKSTRGVSLDFIDNVRKRMEENGFDHDMTEMVESLIESA